MTMVASVHRDHALRTVLSSLFISLAVSSVPTDHLSFGASSSKASSTTIVGSDVASSKGEPGKAGRGSMYGVGM